MFSNHPMRALCASFAAVCYVCLLQILTISERGRALQIAAVSFALAIPMLVALAFVGKEFREAYLKDDAASKTKRVVGMALWTLGCTAAMVGLIATLVSISTVAGVLFAVTSGVSAQLVMRAFPHRRKDRGT